jgi:very-short-patch-repair endonuclease
MRRTPTDAEAALWRILRDRRLATLKFRRQAPIPPYIADFVCFAHRLIVEADGSQHAESARDAKRDAFLESQGFQVLRFWNADILARPRMIEDTILARCGLLG